MCVCLSHRQSEICARAMGALRNMLGSLPGGVVMCGALPGGVAMCGALPGGVAMCGEVRTAATMWRTVMDLVVTGGVAMCGDVTGLLLVLVEMMKDIELQQVQLFLSVPSFIPPLEQPTYIHVQVVVHGILGEIRTILAIPTTIYKANFSCSTFL